MSTGKQRETESPVVSTPRADLPVLCCSLKGHTSSITALLFLTDADAFVSASEDCTLRLWVEDTSIPFEADPHYLCTCVQPLKIAPTALAWDGCRQWLYVGLENGSLLILGILSDQTGFSEVKSYSIHQDRITGMQYDHVNDSVITVSRDRCLSVFNIKTEVIRGGQVGDSWISTVVLFNPYPHLTLALCATYASTILFVDYRWQPPRVFYSLLGHGGSVRCLYHDTKKKYLFLSGFDSNIHIWSLVENPPKPVGRLLEGHRQKVNGVAYHSGLKRAISAGDDQNLIIWDVASGKRSCSIAFAHADAIEGLFWGEEKRLLFTHGADKFIKVWRFSGDSRTQPLAATLSARRRVWDTSQGVLHSSSSDTSPNDAPSNNEFVRQLDASDNERKNGSNVYDEVDAATSMYMEQDRTFEEFIDLRDPAAQGTVRSLNSFIRSFVDRKSLLPEDSMEYVQNLMTSVEDKMRSHPYWAMATQDEIDIASEKVENYVMGRLYYRVFGTSEIDQKKDQALDSRMKALAFISPCHMELPSDIQWGSETAEKAKNQLLLINTYTLPGDKLNCIMQCCKYVHDLLVNGDGKSSTLRETAAGADEFLPMFIYVVLKAQPTKLGSNIEYIQRFRFAPKMASESGCFFTHLCSAVYFIENLTADSLNITKEEFDLHATTLLEVESFRNRENSLEESGLFGATSVGGETPMFPESGVSSELKRNDLLKLAVTRSQIRPAAKSLFHSDDDEDDASAAVSAKHRKSLLLDGHDSAAVKVEVTSVDNVLSSPIKEEDGGEVTAVSPGGDGKKSRKWNKRVSLFNDGDKNSFKSEVASINSMATQGLLSDVLHDLEEDDDIFSNAVFSD